MTSPEDMEFYERWTAGAKPAKAPSPSNAKRNRARRPDWNGHAPQGRRSGVRVGQVRGSLERRPPRKGTPARRRERAAKAAADGGA